MKRFVFSLLLLISSVIITRYLILSNFGIILFVISIFHLFFLGGVKKALQNIADFLWECAYIQDLLWNVLLQVPLNLLFCTFTDSFYLYGVPGETISSATGKNIQLNSKNKLVHLFSDILSFFLGKNHALNSIQDI